MAQTTGQKKQLYQLRQEIAHSRDRLARDLGGLRYELDFPLKFRKSFQRSTTTWVAAAAVAGVLFSFMPARRKKVQIEHKSAQAKGEEHKKGMIGAGLALGLLKFAATLARPAIMRYVTNRMTGGGGSSRRV